MIAQAAAIEASENAHEKTLDRLRTEQKRCAEMMEDLLETRLKLRDAVKDNQRLQRNIAAIEQAIASMIVPILRLNPTALGTFLTQMWAPTINPELEPKSES